MRLGVLELDGLKVEDEVLASSEETIASRDGAVGVAIDPGSPAMPS